MKRKNNLFKKRILLGIVIILAAALLPSSGASVQKEKQNGQAVGKQIVVMFKSDISDSKLKSFTDKYDGSVRILKHIEDYALFLVPDTADYNKTLKRLSSEPQVLSAQTDSNIHIMSTSKDKYSDSQWYINNPGYFMDYSFGYRLKQESVAGIDMDVAKAWKTMAKSDETRQEVVVAVIDTGVDYSHEDLKDHMWVNQGEIPGDNIDNDNNGYIDDVYGWDFYNNDSSTCHYDYNGKKKEASAEDDDNHGTHIAGIIAADVNNKKGIAGIASNIDVRIMTLKINGGENGMGKMSDAIEAVKYATMMGADICNLSWGTTEYSKGLYEAMKESDMLFVAAAGNSGEDNDEAPLYPADYNLNNLITVTAIDSDGELAEYSNYGAKSVDIAAPGDDIYSTVIGGYKNMSGSSMAAPQVTSVAALLYSSRDHIYAADAKKILINNIKPLPDLKNMIRHAGIPDAYKAVLSEGQLEQDNTAPVLSFKTIYKKKDMIIPIHAKDAGNSQIRVIKWIYGKKTAQDFKRGIEGTLVENHKVSLKASGNYTFYASDYAGNEIAVTYKVTADNKAPALNASYMVSDNYKLRTVTIKANDAQSGIKRVKYMPGVKKAEDFLPEGEGTIINLEDGEGNFKVNKDGTFTIFASDNRGNITVKTVKVKTIKSTELKFFDRRKNMSVGDIFYMKTHIQPAGSTDKIIYMSSDGKVAEVTYTGKVIALAKGNVRISAETSSGLKAVCYIKVCSDA